MLRVLQIDDHSGDREILKMAVETTGPGVILKAATSAGATPLLRTARQRRTTLLQCAEAAMFRGTLAPRRRTMSPAMSLKPRHAAGLVQ